MFKRLVNYEEELTNERLKDLAKQYGVHVYLKVRMADVLPIEKSGIADDAYRFALQSHFDFLIADTDIKPLFGVEYNGPSHVDPVQQKRDALKMDLCKHFRFPLLRVNFQYLLERRAGLDLLGWFIHAWFLQRNINEAYASGQIPLTDDVTPVDVISLPSTSVQFPLWLSADIRVDFAKRAVQNRDQDPIPSCIVRKDAEGNHHALAWLRINSQSGLRVYTGMRAQLFRISVVEVVEDLGVLALHDALIRSQAGEALAVPIETLTKEIREFRRKYGHVVSGSWYGSWDTDMK
jgi:hypothetical protein